MTDEKHAGGHAQPGDAMLRVEGLVSGYGKVTILNGVEMEVRRGGIVALLGGNGTGKSTLLKTVSGLIGNTAGSVIFDGERIDGLRPDLIVRRGLVQVTQGKEAFPAMTVEENLRIGAFTVSSAAKIRSGLEMVYGHFPVLEEKRKQLSATLSGGQLQMLCLGRGLMARPKMIMVDEPSAALAPQVVMDIFRAINHFRDEGMTVLVVEQNVRMALLLADYGYVIRDGAIAMEGEAEAMIGDENLRYSFLGGTVAAGTEA